MLVRHTPMVKRINRKACNGHHLEPEEEEEEEHGKGQCLNIPRFVRYSDLKSTFNPLPSNVAAILGRLPPEQARCPLGIEQVSAQRIY